MLHPLFACLPIEPRPRWDRDGGIWYVSQGSSHGDAPTPTYRYKPTINSICEPLLGTSVRDSTGMICGVRYPTFIECCRIYRDGLEIVHVFRDYEDLFTLAMYRRQVSDAGIVLDMLFLELAHAAALTPLQWQELLVRMPPDTPIHAVCLSKAQSLPESVAA